MEGPSLFLAQEQLTEFIGKTVLSVEGNTKIGKERLVGKKVLDIFSWGKHLVFQFDDFAIRIHFLLFGTYEATVNGVSVTGDYKRTKETRLTLNFENGDMKMFNCSIKIIEGAAVKETYDFTIDIMSPKWNAKAALTHMLEHSKEEISDVLLDQTVFSGVGNIIKNEVLSIVKVNPKQPIITIPEKKAKEIIKEAHAFSHQFYEWRKLFELKQHLQIHRKTSCPHCGTKIIREKTGKRDRWAYYCPVCQHSCSYTPRINTTSSPQ